VDTKVETEGRGIALHGKLEEFEGMDNGVVLEFIEGAGGDQGSDH